jgi:hypothetical protein
VRRAERRSAHWHKRKRKTRQHQQKEVENARRIPEDFEVAAQQPQDVSIAFETTRTSLPPLDGNVFVICLPAKPQWISFADWSIEQDHQRTRTDTDSDMPVVRIHIQFDPSAVVPALSLFPHRAIRIRQ